MATPQYIGDASWQRNPGGSQGTTEDGIGFHEFVYRGRLDTAERFIATWPKGTSVTAVGIKRPLHLIAAPIVQDLDGVKGEARLRFEGVEQLEGSVEGTDSEQETAEWHHELKEVYLQPAPGGHARGKYSYLSPTVTYNYVDDHKRDMDKVDVRFRHPLPWGEKAALNTKGSRMQEIMAPIALVGWIDKEEPPRATEDDAFGEQGIGVAGGPEKPTIAHLHKSPVHARGVWTIKQISGFSSISQESDDVFPHTEFHTLVITQVSG